MLFIGCLPISDSVSPLCIGYVLSNDAPFKQHCLTQQQVAERIGIHVVQPRPRFEAISKFDSDEKHVFFLRCLTETASACFMFQDHAFRQRPESNR